MNGRSAHLQYNWWRYGLVVMFAVILWTVVFDMLAAPEKNEKIRITFVGDDFSHEALEKELYTVLPKLTDQPIKSISVESPVNKQSSDYYSVLATRVYGADFIIIQESSLPETVAETYFQPLATEKLEKYVDVDTYYCENGIAYGILLYDGEGENRFSQFYSGDETCYLFLTHTTVNAGDVVQSGNAEDDAALQIIKYFLEE